MKTFTTIIVSALIALSSTRLLAQDQDNSITTTEIKDGIYLLQGRGGNIGLSAGEDGAFMIDDKFAPMAENIKAAIAKISPEQDVRFVLNTHWHRDHTGGNETFGQDGSIIVAHENVRKRLASGGAIAFFKANIPPASPDALPMITFTKDIQFHLNGQDLIVMTLGSGHAHTDGDSVVFFQPANIVHTGDIYFNGLYPFIDGENGGSIDGTIEAVDAILAMIDDETIIIPGHGALSNKQELTAYRDMLSDVAQTIRELKSQNNTLEQIIAAKPTAKYDDTWGKGFLSADKWVKLLSSML